MVDVSKTLQVALQQLCTARVRLDRQIAALERAIDEMKPAAERRLRNLVDRDIWGSRHFVCPAAGGS